MFARARSESWITSFTSHRSGLARTERLSFSTPDSACGRCTLVSSGVHQAQNAAVAIATVGALGAVLEPDWTEIQRGLDAVTLPGRYHTQGKYIFDVAHNPDAARALSQTIGTVNPPRPRVAIVAVLSDKDWRGVLRELAPVIDRFIITKAPTAPPERTWDSAEATAFAKEAGMVAEEEPDFDAALSGAVRGAGTVLVTGSFHTVGDAMSRLQVSPFAP